MLYEELEQLLSSPLAFSNTSDEELLEHFQQKFDMVSYADEQMFVFHHDRQFQNRNHMITLHERSSGRVPMHIFHYIVMTYVYEGSLQVRVEEQNVTLHEGDIMILDKHVPHSVEATSEHDLGINIILHEHYFSNKFVNQLPNDQLITRFMRELMNHQHTHNHYLLFYTKKDALLKNCIQNMLCEHFDPMTCSDDIIDNYIMILITHLARKGQYNTNLSVSLFQNEQLMNSIMNYIQQHYQDGNLTHMCKSFGYDASYTSKLIKRFSGKTIKQLVNDERMKKAVILLQNKQLAIYEIAQQVGIHNLTAFYQRFQSYTGVTPQQYRNRISSHAFQDTES